jgi:Ni/Co efflux regulator RcnB
MKKMMSLIMACAFIVAATVALAADAPEKIVIDGLKAKKAAVTFPHKAHIDKMDGKCQTCHHKWDGKGTPKGCLSCHKGVDKKDKKSGYSAFHKGDRSCKGCHKKEGKKEMTKCSFCHPKK